MSVKFQETVQTQVTGVAGDNIGKVAGAAADALAGATKSADGKKEELSHKIGEYLTGGETSKGYLAVRFGIHGRCAILTLIRPISNNSRAIRYERRC